MYATNSHIGGTPELRVHVLLAGDAEARQEYVAGNTYTGLLIVVIKVPKLHTFSEPRFRAQQIDLARAYGKVSGLA